MSDLVNSSLRELSAALAAKKVSAVELATLFLDRIEKLNPALNAFIALDRDKTLTQARGTDAALAAGAGSTLTGIPLAHKDIFCTNGWRTSCGSKMLANFVSPYDAHVVEKLAAAGMVTLGKLNMDEFAMGSSNETSFFGPVKNPWDVSRVPGGSSGGSAAAIAARLTPAATGTDTGGSIRQPAALCGLTGLKPTYGVVSRYGMIAFASSLDQAGPMAKSAEDCALLLNAMAGFDPRDSTSLERSTRRLRPRPGKAARRTANRFAEGILQRRHGCGRPRRGRSRAGRIPHTGRHHSRGAAAQLRPLGAGLLRDRAGRGQLQPVALRRRAIRLSRPGIRRPH
jgi:aspartyl-tRNA(Asn)/glutamyl-tRNA(Gln) amidotransferase subunit A